MGPPGWPKDVVAAAGAVAAGRGAAGAPGAGRVRRERDGPQGRWLAPGLGPAAVVRAAGADRDGLLGGGGVRAERPADGRSGARAGRGGWGRRGGVRGGPDGARVRGRVRVMGA